MSTVETPAPPAAVERACPRCGGELSSEQEWCLNCGAAVGTRVAGPRGWGIPLAVVGALLAIALAALVLALVELAGPAENVTEVPAGQATPAPAAATPTPSPAAEAGTPAPSPEPGPGQDVKIAKWPAGKRAWTLVLNSSGTRADANRLAREVGAKGVPVGVLDSNDFESLGPDSWVVFSGQYANRADAETALAGIRQQAGGGSAREIVPKTS